MMHKALKKLRVISAAEFDGLYGVTIQEREFADRTLPAWWPNALGTNKEFLESHLHFEMPIKPPSPEGTLFETMRAFFGVVDLTQPAVGA